MSPPRQSTGPRFTPRELPEADLASYVSRRVSAAAWRCHARVTVHAPAAAVAARINPAVGVVTAVDDGRCVLETGADTIDSLAVHLGTAGIRLRGRGPGDAAPAAEADTRSGLETEVVVE